MIAEAGQYYRSVDILLFNRNISTGAPMPLMRFVWVQWSLNYVMDLSKAIRMSQETLTLYAKVSIELFQDISLTGQGSLLPSFRKAGDELPQIVIYWENGSLTIGMRLEQVADCSVKTNFPR